eukprot:NODE_494_length_7750_cov_0.325317.p4 type:complete len:167 gc:universal NODE_494_length_7750_cov_0.325317:2362-1862(-)
MHLIHHKFFKVVCSNWKLLSQSAFTMNEANPTVNLFKCHCSLGGNVINLCFQCLIAVIRASDISRFKTCRKHLWRLLALQTCSTQRPHILARESGSSCFILKRGMALMKENWFERRRTFINNSISFLWSIYFKDELVLSYIWCPKGVLKHLTFVIFYASRRSKVCN